MRFKETDYVHFFNNCYGGFRYHPWFKEQFSRLDQTIHKCEHQNTTQSIAVICLYFYALKTNRLNDTYAKIEFRVSSSDCVSSREYDGLETFRIDYRQLFDKAFASVSSIPDTKLFMKEIKEKERKI